MKDWSPRSLGTKFKKKVKTTPGSEAPSVAKEREAKHEAELRAARVEGELAALKQRVSEMTKDGKPVEAAALGNAVIETEREHTPRKDERTSRPGKVLNFLAGCFEEEAEQDDEEVRATEV